MFGESTPRGRILDRNYKVIVDNKAINNIVYKRDKGVSFKDMIKLAYEVSLGIDLDYYKVTDRAKREFYLYRSEDNLKELISDAEYELYEAKKLSNLELEELKIERVSSEDINSFSESDLKAAVLAIKSNHPYEEVCINVIPLFEVE